MGFFFFPKGMRVLVSAYELGKDVLCSLPVHVGHPQHCCRIQESEPYGASQDGVSSLSGPPGQAEGHELPHWGWGRQLRVLGQELSELAPCLFRV